MNLLRHLKSPKSLLPALSVFAIACDQSANVGIPEEEALLSDLDILLEGAPDSSKLPDEPKSDAIYPSKFDLVALQSPVRNQASRGVCSIFSTVALMEHLYIKEGTVKNPDFSEQFLQWSSKAEVGAFQTSEGSNADRNLEAISRFGVVEESVWPYQTTRWSTVNDARCTGKDQPVVCYTNGEPTAEMKAAKRWKLPRSRWVAARRQSIKAYLYQNRQAVTAGMPFYYQAWNHGGSTLVVSSDYASKGYILFPNDKDIEASKAKPAGHSILIVGWDDDLEVPRLDENGQPMMDAEGKPLTEKGFFLFKNSWGTTRFGTQNPFGAGYGWLSMKYVETYANLAGADLPRLDLGPEACNDGKDNNYNGLLDCEDSETCGGNAACNTVARIFEAKPNAAIPDNAPAGLTSELAVDTSGTATELWVEVDISHTFIRDLKLDLTLPSGRVVTLYDRVDPSGKNIRRRFLLPSLVGESVPGTWKLTVSDNSKGDTGRLNRWTLGLTATGGALVEVCGDNKDNDNNGQMDCGDTACAAESACQSTGPATYSEINDAGAPIPDQNSSGLRSTINITGPGFITDVAVDIDITHSYRGDLTIKLVHPDGTVVTLSDKQGGSGVDVHERFTTNALNGKPSAGAWQLWVVDSFAGDTGSLDAWLLEVVVK
jgi:subtilisin-like proprotein convertase family protein/C1A family cysteine protease